MNLLTQKKVKELHIRLDELRVSRCSALKKNELPTVDATWDYKASNMIYSTDGPVIVDTDNAGRVPRLFDLALALLLFHTEVPTAPGHLFTTDQWQIFLKGYLEHVTLTDLEKQAWQDYLLFVYMDEVLWAINDLEEDEADRQKDFMKSLVCLDFKAYEVK